MTSLRKKSSQAGTRKWVLNVCTGIVAHVFDTMDKHANEPVLDLR
jgi:hypothetical protein